MSTRITTHPAVFTLYSMAFYYLPIAFQAMLAAVLLFILPTLVKSSGEGNIHLLEDEVATALHACTYNETADPKKYDGKHRQRRSHDFDYPTQYGNHVPRIDDGSKQDNVNLYGHERRNTSGQDIMYLFNGTTKYNQSFGRSHTGVKYVSTATIPGNAYNNSADNQTRNRRSDSLIKSEQDQCLSQCVFANLQVVDGRGIPREAELWNKVQAAVTSQQSRIVLKDQIRACFQELQSDPEIEDNGCSYSNKLERCLMLRFSDRASRNSKRS